MTTGTNQMLMDRVEEGLADLWFLMEEAGEPELQEEIEEIARLFPAPEESEDGRRAVERAHALFRRLQTTCPHCMCRD